MQAMTALVFMGVSGCGKSSAGAAVAAVLGLPMLEGDDYHPKANIEKMRHGIPLNDADRAGWLATLGQLMARHPHGAVLSCSALKSSYRDLLRSHVPGLKFVYLDLSPALARQRVAGRGADHFLPVSIVESQFATLEAPLQESGVLRVDATWSLPQVVEAVAQWLRIDTGQQ
jgi:gluconokinase